MATANQLTWIQMKNLWEELKVRVHRRSKVSLCGRKGQTRCIYKIKEYMRYEVYCSLLALISTLMVH